MPSNQEVNDEEATLSLARQIGLKSGCNPAIAMPEKEQKYKASYWKLIYQYFQTRPAKPFSNQSKKNNQETPKRTQVDTLRMTGFSERRAHSSQKKMRQSWGQQNRIQTARTTFGRRKNYFSDRHTSSFHKNKSSITQNKNLLHDLWHQQDHKKANPEVKLFNPQVKRILPTTKPKNKRQMLIKFNSTVKSFQFC